MGDGGKGAEERRPCTSVRRARQMAENDNGTRRSVHYRFVRARSVYSSAGVCFKSYMLHGSVRWAIGLPRALIDSNLMWRPDSVR